MRTLTSLAILWVMCVNAQDSKSVTLNGFVRETHPASPPPFFPHPFLPPTPPHPVRGSLFTDSTCATALAPGTAAINALLPADGTCQSMAALGGSGKIAVNAAGTFTFSGYQSSTTCAGNASLVIAAPFNVCTQAAPNVPVYLLLATTLSITGSYMGGSCAGTSLSSPSINAVGAPGKTVCTNSGTNSLSITTDASGSTYTLKSYFNALDCKGNPITTWPSAAASGCASGSLASLATAGTGAALPTAPTPSPSPSPSPFPQQIALLGVYSDEACSTLYQGVSRLDAVGSVGGCSGLTGLGSGYITNNGPKHFDVKGHAGTTTCADKALAVWKNAPLGHCHKSESTPLPGIYVLLSRTLIISSVTLGTDCTGAVAVFSRSVVPVGLESTPACSAVASPQDPKASVSVLQNSNGTFSIKGFSGTTSCSGAPSITFPAASPGTCSTAKHSTGADMALSLGGFASAPPASVDPPQVYLATLTLPLIPLKGLDLTKVKASTSVVALVSALRASIANAAGLGKSSAAARAVTITSMTSTDAAGGVTTVAFSPSDAANAADPPPGLRGRALEGEGEVLPSFARLLQAAAASTTFTYSVTAPATAVAALATAMSTPASANTALGATNVLVLYSMTAGGDLQAGTPDFTKTTPAVVQAVAVVPPPSPGGGSVDSLGIGLGVGLGVGIPLVAILLYFSGCFSVGKPAPPTLKVNVPTAAAASV